MDANWEDWGGNPSLLSDFVMQMLALHSAEHQVPQ